jgi:hypothetical protein
MAGSQHLNGQSRCNNDGMEPGPISAAPLGFDAGNRMIGHAEP